MAAHAERQGELLGSNFLRSLKNQPLNPYKTGKKPFFYKFIFIVYHGNMIQNAFFLTYCKICKVCNNNWYAFIGNNLESMANNLTTYFVKLFRYQS